MESCCRCSLFKVGIRSLFKTISSSSSSRRTIHNGSAQVSNSGYCVNVVRKFDHEHYLCTLLLPEAARRAAFAVRAFNVEIAQVRDVVSDVNIGRMRLEFWRETLEAIYKGSVPKAPVAMEIAHGFGNHGDVTLTKQWFMRMIDAREQTLTDHSMLSVAELEKYADRTSVSPLLLILQTLGVSDVTADHIASHLGKAQGYVTLIRGIPFNARQERVYIPTELLVTHKVSQEDVLRGSREQKMKDVVYEAASHAHGHLNQARAMKKDVPRNALPAFLPSVCVDAYLTALQKADFDVFHPTLQRRNAWLPLKLFMHNMSRRI